MTASGVQSKIGTGRRIIERPRLTKLLDETDARTILLLAPAGYGKTTLARQWLKGMSGCISLSLTPSDRDVVWLAEEIARELEPLGEAAARLIREHILARPSPGKAAAALGRALVEALRVARVQWVFLDNYEAITESPESEDLVSNLESSSHVHLLVASRVRPQWASVRRSLYGDVFELGRTELAMTEEEVAKVVGRRPGAARIASQAHGWAAVIGLAATVEPGANLPTKLPKRLHRYLAEELFSRVPTDLRDDLFGLALAGPDPRGSQLERSEANLNRLAALEALGFGAGVEPFELHPLIEDFLLEKLLEESDAAKRIRRAIETCLREQKWERALTLVTRFDVRDMIDSSLRAGFKPLVRTGRLTHLAALAASPAAELEGKPLPAAVVVQAEVALGNGQVGLAQELAERAEAGLCSADPLASRAAAIRAQCLHLKADLKAANAAFQIAYDRAQDERDLAEALNGIGFTTIFNELPNAPVALAEMRKRRNDSSAAFLRYSTADAAYRILGGQGLGGSLALDAIRRAWTRCDDPRARSSAAHQVAYQLAISADYESANQWMQLFLEDALRFDLEFTIPLANWTIARIALGRRRFGEVERALEVIEREAMRTRDHQHSLNAAIMRARLALQSGDIASALAPRDIDLARPFIPSWRGEYLGTQALALALAGNRDHAARAAAATWAATTSHDARMFAQMARVACHLDDVAGRRALIRSARDLNVWDPVLCGARASADIAQALSDDPETRPSMEMLYQIAHDLPLARRAGFRTRSTSMPDELLTPREFEVLGLIARGCKNRDISRALFISDSTTKVHVRHILEKLGVRSRAEAAARYEKGLAESARQTRREE